MRKNISIIIIVLIIVLGGFFIQQNIYLPKDEDSEKKILFVIEPGERVKEIALNLENQGLIRNNLIFKIYVALSDDARRLKAGAYELSPSMTVPEIVTKIRRGEVAKKEITIIEGWSLRDIGQFFEAQGMFQQEELFELACFTLYNYCQERDMSKYIENFRQDFHFLKDKPKNVGLEGYLFPDTYEIKKEESLEKIVIRMLENFDKKLAPELREEIENQGKTIFEIVTMASLIEREVKSLEDKKLVSGILWTRLEKGMPLQVDATIIYITGKRTIRIPRKYFQIDSPFNTYKFRGLPLGPISNPGLNSLIAAIYPKASDYLFYLSAPDSRTIFSRTYREHKIAIEKYLRN